MHLFQGIVGNLSSGKSALVHRYLTGTYVQEESPEGKVWFPGCLGVGWVLTPLRGAEGDPSPCTSSTTVVGLCSSPGPCLGCPLLAPPLTDPQLCSPKVAGLRRRSWWMGRATCC